MHTNVQDCWIPTRNPAAGPAWVSAVGAGPWLHASAGPPTRTHHLSQIRLKKNVFLSLASRLSLLVFSVGRRPSPKGARDMSPGRSPGNRARPTIFKSPGGAKHGLHDPARSRILCGGGRCPFACGPIPRRPLRVGSPPRHDGSPPRTDGRLKCFAPPGLGFERGALSPPGAKPRANLLGPYGAPMHRKPRRGETRPPRVAMIQGPGRLSTENPGRATCPNPGHRPGIKGPFPRTPTPRRGEGYQPGPSPRCRAEYARAVSCGLRPSFPPTPYPPPRALAGGAPLPSGS